MLATAAGLAATVLFGPATTIAQHERVADAKPDPVEGIWLVLKESGRDRLLRIHEDGRVVPIPLPAQLEGESLSVSPLQGGWTVAVARYVQPGPPRDCCRELEEPEGEECCAQWMLAQLAPDGRWGAVHVLPHSRSTLSWVSEPAESHGHIELAWGERYSHRVRVAEAPLGGPLGRVHVAGAALKRRTGEVSVRRVADSLYEVTEYGPDARTNEPNLVVERRLLGNGQLGRVHTLRSRLLRDRGTYFNEPDGSQLDLYSVGDFDYFVARRARFAHHFQRSRFLLPRVTGSPEEGASESLNGRLLLVMEPQSPRLERTWLDAVAIAPAGIPQRPRFLEGSPESYWGSAIDDSGEWLVAVVPFSGGHVWLHPYSPRCVYRKRRIPLPGADPAEYSFVTVAVGRGSVFHVVWTSASGDVVVNSVRVACAKPPRAKPPAAIADNRRRRIAGDR
jgi:hypothetical protein